MRVWLPFAGCLERNAKTLSLVLLLERKEIFCISIRFFCASSFRRFAIRFPWAMQVTLHGLIILSIGIKTILHFSAA